MSGPELTEAERLLLSRFPAVEAILRHSDPGMLQTELLGLVSLVTGVMLKSDPDAQYAAAQVTMMDREGGLLKAITYPVTRVVLLNVFNDRMPQPYRSFRVDESGWTEEQ